MNRTYLHGCAIAMIAFGAPLALSGQQTVAPNGAAPLKDDDEVVLLSPFVVSAAEDSGYAARYTLAGTRIRTDLKDVGSSISVVTSKFLKDTNSTNLSELLVYTPNAEVAGPVGNFLGAGDNVNAGQVRYGQNRIRGLVSADITRDFFLSDIPFDPYNVGRIDIQRGPNSILFGIGSPAGIINYSLNHAAFKNSYKVENKVDNFGRFRLSGDFNQVLIDKQLAVRVSLLDDDTKYRQKPAFRDDRRIFTALRWDPAMLNRGEMTASFDATYESGNIKSNLPRQAPPGDYMSPWFSSLSHLQANGLAFRTGATQSLDPGNEYLMQAGLLTQGAAIAAFSQGQPDVAYFQNAGGARAIVGDAFHVSIGSYSQWANKVRLPGYTINAFKDRVITDRSIFDSYDHLLDGNTKGEFNKFSALSAAFRQSFGGDLAGYELYFDQQKTHTGSHNFLSDSGYAIVVDVMGTLPGGTIGGADDPLNPHLGQPFVYGGGGAGSGFRWTDDTKTTLRATAYFNLDFNKIGGKESIFARVLGRNTFNGMATRYRNAVFSGSGSDYYTNEGFGGTNSRRLYVLDYLTSAKLTGNSASGIHLSGLADAPSGGLNFPIQVFNTTTSSYSTGNFTDIVSSTLPEEQRTYSAGTKLRDTIDSGAVVWQGYWFDGTVVPMIGIRKDRSHTEDAGAPPSTVVNDFRVANVYSSAWNLGDPSPSSNVTSRTYSVVTHLPGKWREKLPGRADFQLIYNQSENFDPRPGRVDVYNRALPNPDGRTKEYGVAISALDDKLYLKLVHYKTTVRNADIGFHDNINALAVAETWARASAMGHLGKFGAVGPDGPSWRTGAIYGTSAGHLVTYRPHGPQPGQAYTGRSSNEPPAGTIRGPYTEAELAQAYQAQVTASTAYLNNPPPDAFLAAMGIDKGEFTGTSIQDVSFNQHASAVVTGTTISEGDELELVANPIRGLDITLNVSKTSAKRTEMAQSYLEYVESRRQVFDGPAGDVRLWANGEDDASNDPYTTQGNGTARIWFDRGVMPGIQKFIALQDTNVPELKPWAFNAVANYTFQSEAFRGFNAGAAYRWQDRDVIGFPVVVDSVTGQEREDPTRPFYGPKQDAYDGWLGYQRKLPRHMTWRIQLNVRNIFANDKLIRAATNPDGSPAYYRIPEPRTVTLTNSIEF